MNNIIIKNLKDFNEYQDHRTNYIKTTNDTFENEKYDLYINCIKTQLNLDISNSNFKSDQYYTVVTENVTFDVGNVILNIICNEFNNIFINNLNLISNVCSLNDSIGKPTLYNYKYLNNIAPTNLRYIYHSLLILSHIKELNLNDVSLIEIGGGYGGLALFINKLSVLFNINIKSYTIYDLPEVCSLIDKFSNELNLNITTSNILNTTINHESSFLISNYAYSELPLQIKKTYIDKIFNCINNGLLIWNYVPFDKKYLENIHITNNIIIDVEQFSCKDLIVKF